MSLVRTVEGRSFDVTMQRFSAFGDVGASGLTQERL